MATTITNIPALRAQSSLSAATNAANVSMLRLITGYRINSAKDDPAGLQISDRLTSEINGLKQAYRNSADGQAFAQTAEGALDEIINNLQTIRTKALQSATGTVTTEDREALQEEVSSLSQEITRIAEDTTFGGKTILNGTNGDTLYDANGDMTLQIGAYSGNTMTIDMSQSFTLENLDTAVLAEIGGGAQTVLNADHEFDISTQDKASAVVDQIDSYIAFVDSKRAELGAVQNRLDSAMNVSSISATNLADARSRIRDTDYAEETSNLMRYNILQQTSMAMLTQANNRGSLILQLIGGV